MSKIIGLTGGIATGKSTASRYLQSLGAQVIDLDKITHDLENNNKNLITEIKENFGQSAVQNGKVNRKALAKIVFADPKKLKLLVAIINPYLLKAVNKQLKKFDDKQIIIVDAPTLFENGVKIKFDGILMITCDPKVQLERLMIRNSLTKSEAQKRINAQLPQFIKAQLSTWVIDHSSNRSEFKRKLSDWYNHRKETI